MREGGNPGEEEGGEKVVAASPMRTRQDLRPNLCRAATSSCHKLLRAALEATHTLMRGLVMLVCGIRRNEWVPDSTKQLAELQCRHHSVAPTGRCVFHSPVQRVRHKNVKAIS